MTNDCLHSELTRLSATLWECAERDCMFAIRLPQPATSTDREVPGSTVHHCETCQCPEIEAASAPICSHPHVVLMEGTMCLKCTKTWVSSTRPVTGGSNLDGGF